MGEAIIILADARHIPLADESVHCVVTSPPYWGLRDYGIEPQIWGAPEYLGDAHEWEDNVRCGPGAQELGNGEAFNGQGKSGHQYFTSAFCRQCGAWRGVLGLEPTPELYVQHIVEVFREIKRVCRKDATVWVNLGDSYCGTPTGKQSNNQYLLDPDAKQGGKGGFIYRVSRMQTGDGIGPQNSIKDYGGLKPKDLCGIPWRVAFALQADGWWLRSDIIWDKPNPMPESVTDRPTKSHEYIFLLAKSESYFYDADAVRESAVNEKMPGYNMTDTSETYAEWNGGNSGLRDLRRNYKANGLPQFRNRRSVWRVATQPYADAHFATYPEDLIKPCIMAGSPVGGVVLDPFVGSGTTIKVAQDLGRIGVGLDLKRDYLKMARVRSAQYGLVLRGCDI